MGLNGGREITGIASLSSRRGGKKSGLEKYSLKERGGGGDEQREGEKEGTQPNHLLVTQREMHKSSVGWAKDLPHLRNIKTQKVRGNPEYRGGQKTTANWSLQKMNLRKKG